MEKKSPQEASIENDIIKKQDILIAKLKEQLEFTETILNLKELDNQSLKNKLKKSEEENQQLIKEKNDYTTSITFMGSGNIYATPYLTGIDYSTTTVINGTTTSYKTTGAISDSFINSLDFNFDINNCNTDQFEIIMT